ncbi:MAG: SDR family NAD(P)-dependent oxidoreductase [Flavobacteriales bacterium]|jgi:NAD dependent epimerase/dehydratase|nr:SDR family NAD(P)-dependent oxidoreductase [Flavobacteriales bacterium]MBL0034678.1 SDR family NAD(P)-dependent oxidoreductase [Flavobacteriales bacterium]
MSKRALVSGAGGFIGSHVVEALVRSGRTVRAIVRYNSRNSWGWLDHLAADVLKEVEVVASDVRDPNGMRTVMKDINEVYHLAALIGIPYSYHAPDSYVDTNITGTLNILQAARDHSVERLLVTSTSEVYGTAITAPITEAHPLQGQSPYSASKIGADHMALSFHMSFGTPVTIVRPFNTYGPRQSARAVIPTIITQLLAGAEEIKLGAITPTRDLVFVEDTARAFVAIGDTPSLIGQVVNIATEQEIAVGDLAELIMRVAGRKASIRSTSERIRPDRSEVERLLGSAQRLKAATDWSPSLSLEEGVQRTVAWFSEPTNREGYKWQIYNV